MKLSKARVTIVDVETTGLDYAAGDRVVQLAAVAEGFPRYVSLYNPGRPIPPEASGVHHVTDEMVENSAMLEEVMGPNGFLRANPIFRPDVFVAHNADFDRTFLHRFDDTPWTCTMRLAQHLFPDAPNFKNQTLRYYLGINVDDELGGLPAHDALGDAIVTEALYRRLVTEYLGLGYIDDLDAFIDFSKSPIHFQKINFGKHKGERIDALPKSYVRWLLDKSDVARENLDLRASLEAVL